MLPFDFFRIKQKKMKKLILAFIILTKIIHGQVNDNFSDGDFFNNPTWSGDISQFEVNINHQLHLNSFFHIFYAYEQIAFPLPGLLK